MLKTMLKTLLAGKGAAPVPAGIDITAVWDRCHAHLRPYPQHLPRPAADAVPCPGCASEHAARVVAHLRFADQGWVEHCHPVYCWDCDRFYVPAADLETYCDQIRQSRDGLSGPSGELPVTAVNARLWSSTPTVLNIEPTTQCNFSCWYCIGRHMAQQDLSLANFTTVLDHFPSLKIVAIVGEGEPVLNKQFFPMVRLAKERGLRVFTLSNGSVFSASVIRQICATGIDYIGISIDSVKPEVFAQSRCGGDLEKVWRGIARLRRYRDAHGYAYPILGLKGTLFRHTADELVAIARQAREHGIDVLESFQPLNPKTSYRAIYPPDKQPWLADYDSVQQKIAENLPAATAVLPDARAIAAREGWQVSNSGTGNGLRKNCDEEWIYSLLSGDVTPCCQIKTPLDPAWNLTRHSIDEILCNANYERTRFNLWNGLFPTYCEGCTKTLPG